MSNMKKKKIKYYKNTLPYEAKLEVEITSCNHTSNHKLPKNAIKKST